MNHSFAKGVLGCLGMVMLGAGCQSAKQGAEKELPKSIEGTVWEMTTYLSVSGTMDPKVHKSMVYMEVKEGKLSGHAGANGFFGGIEVDGSFIKISTTGSTMMMGTPELMAQEGQFLKLLGLSVAYRMDGEELHLQDADGKTVLTFKARIEPSLTSKVWKSTGVNNGKGGVSSLLHGSEITAEFTEEGQISGTSGCNTYSGGYEVDGDQISFGPIAGTRMMCGEPAGLMDQEMHFLQALAKANRYSIKEGRLELRDAGGALQASFSTGSD